MKKAITILLSCAMLLTACSVQDAADTSSQTIISTTEQPVISEAETTVSLSTETTVPNEDVETTDDSDSTNSHGKVSPMEGLSDSEFISKKNFSSLNDPKLLQYVEDTVYSTLTDEFSSEDFIIDNVSTVYVSKEYIEELEYNSKANIFFGYTLAELDEQFQGTKYIFTLGDNGQTVVEPFEEYDDTYEKALKNVAIGTGVIFVCVTVSVVSGGVGMAPVSMVFAASAKTATEFALSSGVIGSVSAAVIEGFQTKDYDKALKAAALGGSEAFKWGAISGVLVGGASELTAIHRATKAVEGVTEYTKGAVDIPDNLFQWRQAELRALNEYGGFEQLSYLNGKKVEFGTPGATRPDIIRNVGDHIEAIEVKYYDLENPSCLRTLYRELEREVSARVVNLPRGSTQKVILDVTGRGYSETTCNLVRSEILKRLENIYPQIPIEIVGT